MSFLKKWLAKPSEEEVLQDIPENNPNKIEIKHKKVEDNTFAYQAVYDGKPLRYYPQVVACSGLLSNEWTYK